jgi:hypothetical protein
VAIRGPAQITALSKESKAVRKPVKRDKEFETMQTKNCISLTISQEKFPGISETPRNESSVSAILIVVPDRELRVNVPP